ncbi:MAG: bifunctional phosphopantothenoylcysteine decarboxylase/phosphopantothenate--cysteine ligase CoaBC, partial [Beijerinckiaceae bacterium]|nr:bifunctional phosphopantothenoylcysteine decarboxylase/phosphopantothenate--cysteine ligase CoaBC [Beijerinckiaceae bacterium]
IAAYKALELVRVFRQRNTQVQCVLTPAAQQFITALSAASLSGQKVFTELFSLTDEAMMGHIELSRSADLIVIVPATADLLAKMANGLADDLASTVLLATDKKILAAPAMNLRMWLHPATQRNVVQLQADGVTFVGPGNGEMACGEFGPGRMAEPANIAAAAETLLNSDTHLPLPANLPSDLSQPANSLLAGKHVVVTSGPTHEPIDPVRYIANRSSGIQGHAIAAAAAAAGARVTLISGPVSITDPAGITVVKVETAADMLEASKRSLPADIFIAAAAVADWRVAEVHKDKVKKNTKGAPELKLVENPDILKTISTTKANRPYIVAGFAAETADLIKNAQQKLARKECDLIVANDVGAGSGVMGGQKNTVHLITAGGVEAWPELDKTLVAVRLITALTRMLTDKESAKR